MRVNATTMGEHPRARRSPSGSGMPARVGPEQLARERVLGNTPSQQPGPGRPLHAQPLHQLAKDLLAERDEAGEREVGVSGGHWLAAVNSVVSYRPGTATEAPRRVLGEHVGDCRVDHEAGKHRPEQEKSDHQLRGGNRQDERRGG